MLLYINQCCIGRLKLERSVRACLETINYKLELFVSWQGFMRIRNPYHLIKKTEIVISESVIGLDLSKKAIIQIYCMCLNMNT